jgi:hypothetical protein
VRPSPQQPIRRGEQARVDNRTWGRVGILTGMQLSTRPLAAMRAVIVVLLLSGLGLWQAWQCSDGMAASPITGMPSMSAMQATAESPADPVTMVGPSSTGPAMPMGLAGVCLTVLASVAAAFLLLTSPLRLIAMLRRITELILRPVQFAATGPVLAQLCISRT